MISSEHLVSEQVLYLLEEVLPVGVLLVGDSHIQGVLEYRDHVGTVGRTHKVEWDTQILNELVLSLRGTLINVDLVSNDDARHVWALSAHLFVPTLQVLVGHLARRVKDKNGGMCAEVVGRV